MVLTKVFLAMTASASRKQLHHQTGANVAGDCWLVRLAFEGPLKTILTRSDWRLRKINKAAHRHFLRSRMFENWGY